MAANFVQVATDSTGKKLQTFNNTISTQDVHAEAVVLVDGTGTVVSSWPVTGTFWQATQPVSGTLAATQSGTWTVQPGNTANTVAWKVDGSAVTQPVSGTFWQTTQPVSGTVTVQQSTASSLKVDLSGTSANATAIKTDGSAVTQPVSGTFWQSTQPVSIAATVATKESRSATAATTQVADTAVSTTLLASNASRLGATIANDSSGILYVKLGTTASLTDYTVRLVQYAYFEIPFGYTGRIDGIWATDPNDGSARMTELT